MEIQNLKAINRGAIVATFDVKIEKWGNFIIHGMQLYRKDGRKWINFPSFKIEPEDEPPKYLNHCRFEDRKSHDAFVEKLMPMLEQELAQIR